MNTNTVSEILLNATVVTPDEHADAYEFILDDTLHVKECVHVESLAEGLVCPVSDYNTRLKGVLFELNHVRVNPQLDNSTIIATLTTALKDIGVNIFNPPDHLSMAMCFKPLGEISDNVRFYCESDGKVIFLSPTGRLRVIPSHQSALAPHQQPGK